MTDAQHHWTNDPERVEDYVLGRLGKEERGPLDNHLRTCEVCRAAVRMEQELAAGVKRTARDELKGRLRQRLGAEPVRSMPWLQLAAAAAVIVIIVGIGVYNDWFSTYRDLPPKGQEEIVSREDEKPPTGERQSAEGESRRPAPSTSSRLERTSAPAPRVSRREELRDDRLAAEGAGAALEMQAAPSAAKEAETFWVEGNVLPPSAHFYGAPAEEVSGRGKTKALDGVKVFVRQQDRSQAITLQQRPAEELSDQFRSKKQRVVPTLVEKTDQGVNMTMYVDTPFSQKELAEATAESPREDSLILNVGNQQIGYRIHGIWAPRLPAKQD